MKRKFLLTALGMMMVFIFFGCAQPTEDVNEPITPPTEVEQPTTPDEVVNTGDVDAVEEELSLDELDDLDDVLSDIENI